MVEYYSTINVDITPANFQQHIETKRIERITVWRDVNYRRQQVVEQYNSVGRGWQGMTALEQNRDGVS
jgi:hypothetical protein